jgi:hypothetical protein
MSPLDARKKSFMLLPDFTYQPGREVTLGSVLSFDRDLKIPSPNDPYPFRIEVTDDRIESAIMPQFEANVDNMDSKKGWIDATISCLTGVGGGIKGERQQSSRLQVKSERITRTIFRPSREDFKKVLSDKEVMDALSLRARDPVFLITGLMVAHGAHVEESSGHQHGGGIHADVDLSAAQVPVSLGVGSERSKSLNQSTRQIIPGDFILAYQLVRLQRKLLGDVNSIKGKPENKVALFDGTRQKKVSVDLHDYLEEDVLEELQ